LFGFLEESMRLIRFLILRSLRARPMRTLLSALGIILGVASILAIAITNQTALASITRLFEDTSGKAKLVLVSADSSNNAFSDRVERRLGNYQGVTALIPTLQVQTLLASHDSAQEIGLNFFGSSLGGLLIYGIDPELDILARDYEIIAGKFLSDDLDAYEIVIVEDYAKEKDITLGQKVEIVTPNGIAKMKVVGLMGKSGPGQLNNGGFAIIPIGTVQKLFNHSGEISQLDVVVEEHLTNAEVLESLRMGLQTQAGKDFRVIFPASQGKRMAQMLGNYQIGLNFLSGIALFVGAFLIYNAFTMTVVERTREFGMLRTVGMTSAQVAQIVLWEAVILGVLGSLIGAGLGVLMSVGLSRVMEILLGQDLGKMMVPMDWLAVSVGVGVVVTLFAALVPALQAGRISPLEALRVRGQQKEGRLVREGWKAGVALLGISVVILLFNPFPYDVQFRLGSLTVFSLFFGATLLLPASVDIWERITRPVMKFLYGSTGELGSRNIQRSRLRTTLTVAALMIGVAMILIVRAMTGSFSVDLKEWINAYVGGDLYATSTLPMRSELERRIAAVEGIEALTPIRYLDVKWKLADGSEESITFMAVDPVSYSKVTSFVFSGDNVDPAQALRRLSMGQAVFISSVVAEKYDLHVGDSIELRTRSGMRSFEVAAVVVDFFNQGQVVEGNWDDMRRFFRVEDASTYLIKVSDGYDVGAVKAYLESLYGDRYKLTVESNLSIKQRITTLMDQAFGMFDVLAVLALLVAALGVVNTLTMNVMERTQEIGMLRGVGMTRWQVVKMVLAEAGLMGLIGGAFGLALGIILSRIFLASMMAMSGYDLEYMLPVEGVILGVVVALVVSQLAAMLPARRAARIAVLEAIHYE
jgi:putative ABC transport system permease protein